MTKELSACEYIFTLDTPMAKLFQQLHNGAHAEHDTDKAIAFLSNWRKENPELAQELREYLYQIDKEGEEWING
jgi:hypothetical protein